MPEYEPSLHVYVVFRPASPEDGAGPDRAALAQALYCHLCRDADTPLLRGLGIPVFFRSAPAQGVEGSPLPIALDRAHRTAVIVLAEAGMALRRFGWNDYLDPIGKDVDRSGGRHLLLPVRLDDLAGKIEALEPFQGLQYAAGASDAERKLLTEVSNVLCRFLREGPSGAGAAGEPPQPIRLFISHAKRDGRAPALEFKEEVERLPLDRFFDEVNIAAGYRWTKQIEKAVRESVFLTLLSDQYSSRPWCRREAAEAKRTQRPVVVVDMLETLDLRSFPYLGNAPVIRWSGSEYGQTVYLAMTEALRFEYHGRRLKALRERGWLPANAILLPRAPEPTDCAQLLPLALAGAAEPTVLVYPDPPVGPEEAGLLTGLRPAVTFTTPSVPVAGEVRIEKTIGVSISRSPDLPSLGFGDTHLHDLMTECARHFLARGATVAYGGHHEKREFADRLFELVASYQETGAVDLAPIQSYLAWPLHRDLSMSDEVEITKTAVIHRIPLPKDLESAENLDKETLFDRTNPESRYLWARCLTPMRERMNAAIDVRVVMGGPVTGYLGKYPGLLEEGSLALAAGKPTFLLGAFGGCAAAIIQAVRGDEPEELTEAYQKQDPVYAEMAEQYNREAEKPELQLEAIDYAKVVSLLKQRGVAGLNNRLSEAENERLFESADPDEILYLLLKGLRSLPGS